MNMETATTTIAVKRGEVRVRHYWDFSQLRFNHAHYRGFNRGRGLTTRSVVCPAASVTFMG